LQEIVFSALVPVAPHTAVLNRVKGWLAAGLPLHPEAGGAPARQRAQAGDLLAHLGDPRFDSNKAHLPADSMLGFERIAAKPAFYLGTQAADQARVAKAIGREVPPDERNDKPVAVDEFWMARYAVTVAQFQHYLASSGKSAQDPDALSDPATRPVRWVSWHEALGYCEWLTQQLLTSVELSKTAAGQLARERGLAVCLPSELEWEVAARGERPGQVFSWGDTDDAERANQGSTRLRSTSPVGCFAPNGFGLYDMLGNVWQWTRSVYMPYPYDPRALETENQRAGNNVPRVVRGGAWNFAADGVRCACRGRFEPDGRLNFLGFRVVLRSAPVKKR
jgi:formylglycine-generating enzyme required for sulfatase activity